MKKLLLIFAIAIISVASFGQETVEMKSLDYHVGGLLITQNETPNFLENFDLVNKRYNSLISYAKENNIVEMTQRIETTTQGVRGYILGDRNYSYEFYVIPYFEFRIFEENNKLQYQLSLNLKPSEQGSNTCFNFEGFTTTFNSPDEVSQYIDRLSVLTDDDWVTYKFGFKFTSDLSVIESEDVLFPYYAHTILKDSPKGNRITKVKPSDSVLIMNEGIRYAFSEFLKVSYNGNVGWLSITSFKDRDVYAIRHNNNIVWMDGNNVKF